MSKPTDKEISKVMSDMAKRSHPRPAGYYKRISKLAMKARTAKKLSPGEQK